jgi:hypothetical protein
MSAMRKLAAFVVLAAGCMEPPKWPQMEKAISGLEHLHAWDPVTRGQGQYGYEAVIGWGPEIIPALVAHLTDETPTQIQEPTFEIQVRVGDICLLILLDMTKTTWKQFDEDGLFLTTQLPNPVFCIRWKEGPVSRARVQARFRKLLNLVDSSR